MPSKEFLKPDYSRANSTTSLPSRTRLDNTKSIFNNYRDLNASNLITNEIYMKYSPNFYQPKISESTNTCFDNNSEYVYCLSSESNIVYNGTEKMDIKEDDDDDEDENYKQNKNHSDSGDIENLNSSHKNVSVLSTIKKFEGEIDRQNMAIGGSSHSSFSQLDSRPSRLQTTTSSTCTTFSIPVRHEIGTVSINRTSNGNSVEIRNRSPFAPETDADVDDNNQSDAENSATSSYTFNLNMNNRNTFKKTAGLNGLANIGNTCFMNSVLQCLSNTKLLLEYILQDGFVNDLKLMNSPMKGELMKAFAKVIKNLWSNNGETVDTKSFKFQLQRFSSRFSGYSQQDAQEFLRYLLEGLHEDVKRVKIRPTQVPDVDDNLNDERKSEASWARYLKFDNSKIVDLFVGQLKSTLTCTFCGHRSVIFDPFWDLSLPIPSFGTVQLLQCFESFTHEETLDGDEKPTCSKCKQRRKCLKSFSIQKFPKILVIHLKRFSANEKFRRKLDNFVDFPIENLNLSQFAANSTENCMYDLYAVSNHIGSAFFGHYTAYCKYPNTNTWHEYNDSCVTSTRNVSTSQAYLLFYELKTDRLTNF